MTRSTVAAALVLSLAVAVASLEAADPAADADHPEWDAAYTAAIRAATTAPELTTPLVDHLPASATVPSPLVHHGYIAGAPDHLTYAADVHAYMRALAAASPRVKVFSLGTSEEGREMIAVAVADEATIAGLDEYKSITRRLADPRSLDEATAHDLIGRGKPIYYFTGGLHSPESGSPEMLMELAYRLAVEDSPLVRSIRANVITLITPVLEVDGRERWVDLTRWYAQHPEGGLPPFAYWGHYVVHDNNRDAVGLALALSRHVLDAYLDWHPQVMHDLHESIPFLYISSGTGPYNAWLDPLMVQEWERMAITEVQTLTGYGLPGVWTHGFYDGWAPNYLFWVGMGRNTVGRFYETFGNHVPTTENRVLRSQSTDRAWYRPNPPLPHVRWSLRDNVNYQESGALTALGTMAAEREHFLEQFFRLSQRSVAKARTEGPAAYVFTADQWRQGQLAGLMRLLRRQGVEVHVADKAFSLKPGWPPPKPDKGKDEEKAKADVKPAKGDAKAAKAEEKPKDDTLSFPAGSFVVRMDQPYSRLADALLDVQYVRGEERVYDDTGWTLPFAANVACSRIVNQEVLAVPMHAWSGDAPTPAPAGIGTAKAVVIADAADTDLVRLRVALPSARMSMLDAQWQDGVAWPAGSAVVDLDAGNRKAVTDALAGLHLKAEAAAVEPGGARHELSLPRIALVHTWTDTQDEGWYRLALEGLSVPYAYISTQTVAATPDLRAAYDVILFPPASDAREIVAGLPPGPPLPWKKTELTPNLGVDQTDDMRPGLGLAGIANLTRFVEERGVLLAVGEPARLAVDSGLARYVEVVRTEKLKARGSLVKASVTDATSPIAYGYDDSLPVYFAGGPVFRVGVFNERRRGGDRPSGRGTKSDPDVPQARPWVGPAAEPTPKPGEEGFQLPQDLPFFSQPYVPAPEQRPRVVVAFPKEAETILLSGMLEGADEIAGKALVVDCPRGRGHVVLYGCNPMWRATTTGTYALVLNAVMSWNALSTGWPPAGKPAGQ
jgi:hypothetical protein